MNAQASAALTRMQHRRVLCPLPPSQHAVDWLRDHDEDRVPSGYAARLYIKIRRFNIASRRSSRLPYELIHTRQPIRHSISLFMGVAG